MTLFVTILQLLCGLIVIGIVLHLAAGGQRNQLSPHERMKNMFGELDLDEMRKM